MLTREAIIDVKHAEKIPVWMDFYRKLGWNDFEITITDEAKWRLTGVRYAIKVEQKKKNPQACAQQKRKIRK